MLGQSCQICGNRGKTVKFAEVAEIREFRKSSDAHEKFTALPVLISMLCV